MTPSMLGGADVDTRRAVALNPRAPEATIQMLVQDPDPDVEGAATTEQGEPQT